MPLASNEDSISIEHSVNELAAKGHWSEAWALIEDWPEQPFTLWIQANLLLLEYQDSVGAEQLFRRMLAMPNCPDQVHLRLGKALHIQNRVLEALNHYLKAIVSCRQKQGAWYEHAVTSYGLACLELGLYQHWIDLLRRLESPGHSLPQTFYLKALAYLSLECWDLGWKYYEFREAWFPNRWPQLPVRIWSDQEISSEQNMVLIADMGIGDFIFFLRFVPLLRSRCSSVTVLLPSSLRSLAQGSGFFDQVLVAVSQLPSDCTWVLGVSSICAFLGLGSPRNQVHGMPYINVPSRQARDVWSFSGQRSRACPLVALNWAGNQDAENVSNPVRERSLTLSLLERIDSLQKCDLLSVQIDPDEDIRASSLSGRLHAIQDYLESISPDMWQTAIILSKCDLVITNDTSIAHLGGALGVSTWVMLKQNPSWQWGVQGGSPWYQSVRCFRQQKLFDWTGVIDDVDKALVTWVRDWHFRQGIQESPCL